MDTDKETQDLIAELLPPDKAEEMFNKVLGDFPTATYELALELQKTGKTETYMAVHPILVFSMLVVPRITSIVKDGINFSFIRDGYRYSFICDKWPCGWKVFIEKIA
jgi:hypothetical protein